ncbi:hypothetical protein CC85DRAFT_165168 [Cutaneotrichosporon oleaginosum]|uniref:Zn(2)-C6 fungal-type domain-containing protein n=1 Tax=Cutaneotrichosporon oleaginosum TaxID=879819 RepID=A0A0J0XG50_9TREE|nr:uncharacterized protein CC85DRAFT_165168 [Cutaneotrichosporon oleaginosum]KLT40037.1 hypothetical protein CC85DRAFT_165168 [Cutaneotrichosporon oleaginosum]TXT13821.1 hypothetical protein COLE_00014 [Cutaneotrichosporon oleaginosum]
MDGESHPGHPPRDSMKRKRSKAGCLTCRLRKKRCDETRPTCAACTRLGLECIGYGQRPAWMARREAVADAVADIRKAMAATHVARRRQRWADAARLGEGVEQCTETSIPANPPDPQQSQSRIAGMRDERLDENAFASQTALHPASLLPHDVPDAAGNEGLMLLSPSESPPALNSSSSLDSELAALLGREASELLSTHTPYLPLLTEPSAVYTPFFSSPAQMRYLNHYLTVIMPYQWIFERGPLSDLVTPLAFSHPLVCESVSALAALHIGSTRQRHCRRQRLSRRLVTISEGVTDPDLAVAQLSTQRSAAVLSRVPLHELGTHEMVVAAMCISSFHLFDGGSRPGWRVAVALCRKCLGAIVQRSLVCEADGTAALQLTSLLRRMGHLLAPLVWTDILSSATEGVASLFLPLYRVLLVDCVSEDEATFLRETVMGCDSTTRLALAETIALSEWKEGEVRAGRLSLRALLARASAIEEILDERPRREAHLLCATPARRAVSDIFFHSARVLLATTIHGPYPDVAEVKATVADTVDAFSALDALDITGAERALVFPTVIAGCHAQPELQTFFRDRFVRLGDEAVAFGNTQNALRVMEEVWRRRAAARADEAVHWRSVMFDLDDEGLLLI